MTDPNVLAPEWETPPESPLQGARLGHAAGARELGMTLYELAVGSAISPYHLHHGNEELLSMTSPGAVKVFPDGADTPVMEALAAAMERDAAEDQRATSTS